MNIRELSVQSVLHLDGFALDLRGDASFHIVYGPNEAGKSTLLQLLVDLLFGGKMEDGVNKDLYHSKSRLDGVLKLALGDEERHVRRRRQRSQLVLVDESDQPLPEELLKEYVAGLDRERYRLLFGFDHARLREGGERLLASGGKAGVSLFEAGGGAHLLQGAQAILSARLDLLADTSFRSNSKKLLNSEWRAYKEATSIIRESGLRGEEWQAAHDEEGIVAQQVALCSERKMQAQAAVAKLQRVGRMRALVAEWRQLQESILRYADVPQVASEWLRQIPDVVVKWRSANLTLATQRRELAQVTQELQAIHRDPAVLSQEEMIRSLYEYIGQYTEAVQQLPVLTEQMSMRQATVESLLRDIAPGVTRNELEVLRISFAQEEQILFRASAFIEAQRILSDAEMRLQELTAEQVLQERRVAELPVAQHSGLLRSAVSQARQLGDVDDVLRKLEFELATLYAEARANWQRQSICAVAFEDAGSLVVPLRETVDTFQVEWERAAQLQMQVEREIQSITREADQIAEQLAGFDSGGQVPLEEDLWLARAHREHGWQVIKRVWLNGEPELLQDFAGEQSLETAYETAVTSSDEIADRLRREADRSAQRAQLTLRLAQLAGQRETLVQQQKSALQTERARHSQWCELWSPCGIDPRTPVEMKAWMTDVWQPALTALANIDSARRRYDEALRRRQGEQIRIQQALKQLDQAPSWLVAEVTGDQLPLTGWGDVLDFAEAVVRKFEETERLRAERLERLQESEGKLLEQTGKLAVARKRVEVVATEWADSVREHPALSPDPDAVGRYLSRLRELFQSEQAAQRAETELHVKTTLRRRFEQRAAAIAGELMENVSADQSITSEAIVRSLNGRLEKAKQNELQWQSVVERTRLVELSVAELEVEHAALSADVQAFTTALGTPDHETLLLLVERARERKELEANIQQLERQLAQTGDGLTLAEIIQEVDEMLASEGGMDRLQLQIEKWRQQLAKEDADNQVLAERLGVLRQRLRDWDGSLADAATHAQEAEFHLAEVDRLWQEFVRTELANRLLQRGVEQFRLQNETAIRQRASELFVRLTAGRYRELVVEYEDNEPYLEAITADGVARRMQQLSDGTRDQLHLALRLAFVERHMRANEPLPLILDDILVHFDDERSAATLEVLCEFATRTQVLYFTHHQHVVALLLRLVGQDRIKLHELGGSPAQKLRLGIQ